MICVWTSYRILPCLVIFRHMIVQVHAKHIQPCFWALIPNHYNTERKVNIVWCLNSQSQIEHRCICPSCRTHWSRKLWLRRYTFCYLSHCKSVFSHWRNHIRSRTTKNAIRSRVLISKGASNWNKGKITGTKELWWFEDKLGFYQKRQGNNDNPLKRA